jgi:iron-sulfur cluster repair protein YtfE (RIC family)
MSVIAQYMTQDHRACDESFAAMENAVNDEKWDEATKLFNEFQNDLLYHFDMEEEVMFPAFEARSASAHCNPTPVMIMEHAQMREALKQMREDLVSKNKDHFFGLSESLMMTMQQHNMKEEQMMYPMVDQAMENENSMLLEQMKAFPKKDYN